MSSASPLARTTELPRGETLTIVRGPKRGTIVPLVLGETLIGRLDSNHLIVDDPSVSRVHARVVRTPEGILAEDLDSRAGTFVNGRRLEVPAFLADGDELVVGEVAFVFAADGRDKAP